MSNVPAPASESPGVWLIRGLYRGRRGDCDGEGRAVCPPGRGPVPCRAIVGTALLLLTYYMAAQTPTGLYIRRILDVRAEAEPSSAAIRFAIGSFAGVGASRPEPPEPNPKSNAMPSLSAAGGSDSAFEAGAEAEDAEGAADAA